MGKTAAHAFSLQDQQQARQRHRAELRRKLVTLIELADQQYKSQEWDDFEQTRLAIRLVLSDLGTSNRHMTGARVAERLPPAPSTRRPGAGE